jgi:hypothetical protein
MKKKIKVDHRNKTWQLFSVGNADVLRRFWLHSVCLRDLPVAVYTDFLFLLVVLGCYQTERFKLEA